jgi:hypothetical protein
MHLFGPSWHGTVAGFDNAALSRTIEANKLTWWAGEWVAKKADRKLS